jgi:hypothetical protein
VEIKLVPLPAAAVQVGRGQPAAGDKVNEFTLNLQLKRVAPPLAQPAATPKPGAPAPAAPPPTKKADTGGKDGRA